MTEAGNAPYGVLDLLGEAILILTPAGRIVWANTAGVCLLQLPQPAQGDFNAFLIEGASGTKFQALLSSVDDSPDPPGVTTLSLRLPNAMPLVVEVMVRHCPEWFGANQYLVSMHDVTVNKAREAELNLSAKGIRVQPRSDHDYKRAGSQPLRKRCFHRDHRLRV